MGTKNNPTPYDAYDAAEPDEPVFTLRSNDPLAAGMVRQWVIQRVNLLLTGQKENTVAAWLKVQEALECAKEMDAWHRLKHGQPHERQTIVTHEGKPN
jgi:hypothetical protein